MVGKSTMWGAAGVLVGAGFAREGVWPWSKNLNVSRPSFSQANSGLFFVFLESLLHNCIKLPVA